MTRARPSFPEAGRASFVVCPKECQGGDAEWGVPGRMPSRMPSLAPSRIGAGGPIMPEAWSARVKYRVTFRGAT